MKKNLNYLLIILILATGCKNPDKNTLSIYAAAGSKVVVDEICDSLECQDNFVIKRNYASSGTLARQIANEGECDVFISANKQWIDFLSDMGLLKENSIRIIAGNTLVVVVPIDSHLDTIIFDDDFEILSTIPDVIAIGDPSYVPVGKYTKMVFDTLDWYAKIRDRAVMAKDVSSVLRYVEISECDWGVVYYSEAIQSEKVRIIAVIPGELHKPINFYVADVKGQKEKGYVLSEVFTKENAKSVFRRQGFSVIRSL